MYESLYHRDEFRKGQRPGKRTGQCRCQAGEDRIRKYGRCDEYHFRKLKGENAGNYLRKAEKVQKDILNVSRELKNTATAIRNIAQVTYNAEMAALELALKRNV